MTMEVRIPTPLRSYTAGRARVEVDGSTVAEVLEQLDRSFPGIRFRMVDEQDRLRPHLKVFVGDDLVRDLETSLRGDETITIMQALSGGASPAGDLTSGP